MNLPTFVLIGGFLGAGKTTLILRAATLLRKRGLRVAVITNDQDVGLVDTMLSISRDFATREVAGGCFCCRFSDLVEAADQLIAYGPDIIFAEPVGSCVDISATILQPLKAYHRDQYRLAPFTVLVDPELGEQVYRRQANEDISFLYKNQVEEADLLCVTKIDRTTVPSRMPVRVDFFMSAVTGSGVEEWLTAVLDPSGVAGARVLNIDYRRYAQAEAALGWLNVRAQVELEEPKSPASLVGPLLDELDLRLTEAGIEIAHLKVFDQTSLSHVKASICVTGEDPFTEGDLIASPESRHEIVINLRAVGDPAGLQAMVMRALHGIAGTLTVKHSGAFRPLPPKPEHRFTAPAGKALD